MKDKSKVRRLNRPAAKSEEIPTKMPVSSEPLGLTDSELQQLNAGQSLKEIWGKWPGDESIEELLEALTP